jgi:glycosyltransferase involved in cell wall biosynthesis
MNECVNEMIDINVCVIIPTYNNKDSLVEVIEKTLSQGFHLIVVNDGSTDNTAEILNDYDSRLRLISYPVNKGKGFALQQGFAKACEEGFSYAVTLDSDGQHNPENIRLFVEKLNATGESVIIGNRNLISGNIPAKNTFGKKFSNFWFLVETWKTCKDTQSGFRLYPLKPLMKKHFYTNRFEFEVELLVRLAWDDIPVNEIDIPVIYFPEEKRISHFRPVTDFFRISILNSVLVIFAYLWFLPCLFFLRMRKKTWKELLFNPEESSLKKAKSLAFGVFMGIIPIWGFQMITAFAFAAVLKLNKTLVLLASNISIPPMIPVIVFGSLWCGSLALNTGHVIKFSNDISIQSVGNMLFQYIIGSVILALIVSSMIFLVSYVFLSRILKKQ